MRLTMLRSNDKLSVRALPLFRREFRYHALDRCDRLPTRLPFGYGDSASCTIRPITELSVIHLR